LLFAPYFNKREFPQFALDGVVVLFCLSFAGVMLLSRAVYSVFAALILIVNVVYLHILLHWGGPVEERFSLVLESPTRESLEYLGTYLSGIDAFVLLYVLGCLVAIGLICRSRVCSTPLLRLLALMPLIVLAVLVSQNTRAMKELALITLPNVLIEQPTRMRHLLEREKALASLPARQVDCVSDYANVVVVIGESASADHHVLYGYDGGWRSELEALDFARFSAISPSNQTRYSVPIMLTAATATSFGRFYAEPSLVSELKACGYRTYWLSNQDRSGKQDDNAASMGREADISLFISDEKRSWRSKRHYDEELIDKIKLINAESGSMKKRAFFVHLVGSHFNYFRRFPPSFAPAPASSSEAYDISIRYTDKVLRGLFDAFPKDGLLFVYCSDHGELLSGDHMGHSFAPSHQNEYRVPFLVWSSQPDRLTQLRQYVDGKVINTESFDHVVGFLVGLESDLHQISFSRLVMDASQQVVNYDSLENVPFRPPATLSARR